MNKQDLIDAASDSSIGLSKAKTERASDRLFTTIAKALTDGEDVRIPGFGTFVVVERRARKGRNPKTGEPVDIPARRAVKLTPSKALRDAVNAG